MKSDRAIEDRLIENRTHPTDLAPLIRRVILLSLFTIGYNLIEGIVSMAMGYSDESLALFGFGVDSFIEVGSAFLVLWRFRGETGSGGMPSPEKERRSTLGIGILFMLLAIGALAGGVLQLTERGHPSTTLPGVIISLLSLSFMYYLWSAKKKLGAALQSATVLKDASCSLACIHLSIVLLIGSVLFYFIPSLWWADSVAAIVLSGFIGKEGWETISAARSKDFDGGGCGCH